MRNWGGVVAVNHDEDDVVVGFVGVAAGKTLTGVCFLFLFLEFPSVSCGWLSKTYHSPFVGDIIQTQPLPTLPIPLPLSVSHR